MLRTLSAAATALGPMAGAAAGPAAAQDDEPVVGLVMKSLANEFFTDMLEGAEAHEAERGDDVLEAVGMRSETDIETRIDAVENFITQGVDAIAVAPARSRALVPPLMRAMEAGIVVVDFDVSLDETAEEENDVEPAFVGPDDREGAEMAGEALAEKLGQGGRVIILEGNPGADDAGPGKMGFEDAIQAGGLELGDSRTAHRATEEANTVLTNTLTANPDIRGVMAANASMAVGVVEALEAAGRGDVAVVGFDDIPAVGPMLEDGRMLATVDQLGRQMAAGAIDLALEVVRGGPELEGWVKTDVELVASPAASQEGDRAARVTGPSMAGGAIRCGRRPRAPTPRW